MSLQLDWGVHFVGGPFDGRTEVYASSEEVLRIAILAIGDPSERSDRQQPASLSSVAIYELAQDAVRYQYVRSLPAADSIDPSSLFRR